MATSLIGEIKQFAGATTPTGWLECDGSEVAIADYSDLYDVIGDLWGTPSDNDHFVLPNFKGKVPVGYDSNDANFDTVGETGGEPTVTLTENEIPAHTHGSVSGHQHRPNGGSTYGFMTGVAADISRTRFKSGSDGNYAFQGAQAKLGVMSSNLLTGSAGGHTHDSFGNGLAHNNLQPYAVVKYIICAE